MAHQTGIEASNELKSEISKALHGTLRFLKIVIHNETLIPKESAKPSGNWEKDFDAMIPPVLSDKEPCYILYRLDERNAHNSFVWIFMSYIPDYASVKDKMLYAATKATVKKSFSSGIIIDDIAATHKDELTLDGYQKHIESQKAPPPLTDAEQILKELHASEAHSDIGTASRQSHLHGVMFPIKPEAQAAIEQLVRSELAYVQLSVDVKKETVNLESTQQTVDADSLPSCIPMDVPRYNFYRFKHTHEGDYQEAIIFIYSSPGFKCSIRERMLYSSSKEPVIASLEEQFNFTVAKKLEIDSDTKVDSDFLMDELHPQQQAYRPKFMKPAPPRKRSKSPLRPPRD